MSKKDIGAMGEMQARAFLERKGYRVKARNWRSVLGEVDLICEYADTIVFVEVKTVIQKGPHFSPEDNLTPAKEHTLKKLALAYLAYKNIGEAAYQIDLVAIDLNTHGEVLEIRHHPAVISE